MPGPRDGFHCDRDRFAVTKTVSGCPLRIVQMPDTCQPSASVRVTPDVSFANGSSQLKLETQLCLVLKSDGPLL